MRIADQGVIYRNLLPGHQVVNAYLPFILEVADGELLCIFRRGSAFYSFDGVLCQMRSLDAGKTWLEEPAVHDPREDDRPYNYTGPFLAKLRDTTLVLAAFRVDCSDSNRLVVNPDTGAFLPAETILFSSTDAGCHWSPPQLVHFPEPAIAYVSGPVIELSNGEWLLPFDKGKAYDDPAPLKPVMFTLFSQDRGTSWTGLSPLADGAPRLKAHWHGRLVPLLDGRLFTLLWTQDTTSGQFIDLHRTTSEPSGRDWDVPKPTGLVGQTSWAVDLGGGRMFAAYTVREAQLPGIRGVLSEDAGKSWNTTEELVLWDASGRETIGVSSRNTYPASHDTIAFGRPQATRTASGDVIVSFWCTEACLTCSRWIRVDVG